MKKPRKKYRPKPIVHDVMARIKQGELPATTAETAVRRFRVANHSAMDSLIRGAGTRQDTIALGHMLTTAKALAKHNVWRDWTPELLQAEADLKALQARGGRYIMRAQEINSLNTALAVHDKQIDECTVKQLEDAINAAMHALRCGHEVKERK